MEKQQAKLYGHWDEGTYRLRNSIKVRIFNEGRKMTKINSNLVAHGTIKIDVINKTKETIDIKYDKEAFTYVEYGTILKVVFHRVIEKTIDSITIQYKRTHYERYMRFLKILYERETIQYKRTHYERYMRFLKILYERDLKPSLPMHIG